MTPEKKKTLSRWLIGIATACILIFLGVQNIGAVADAAKWLVDLIMPLLLGFVFALIFNVPMTFFEARIWRNPKKEGLRKLRRPVAFIISLVLILGILAGVVRLVIPELIGAVRIIVQGVIDFIHTLSAMDQDTLAEVPFGNMLLNADWESLLDTMQAWLKNQGGSIMNSAVGTIGSFVGGVFDFFIAVVFAVYILFSKETLKAQATRLIGAWLPQPFGDRLIHACAVASHNFRNFIAGQSLEAVILGVLCMIGMWIFGFPFAPMIGALVGVTALIPVVGGFIGAGVGAFMILTVDPLKAVLFLLYILILQQLEGNIIYPKVMGNRVHLPGIWILAAVTVGGGVAGPVGMLLAVPLTSTAYVLLREETQRREKILKGRNPYEHHNNFI